MNDIIYTNQINNLILIFYFGANNLDNEALITNVMILFVKYSYLLSLTENLVSKSKQISYIDLPYKFIDNNTNFNNMPDDISNYINEYISYTIFYKQIKIRYNYNFCNLNSVIMQNNIDLIYDHDYINNYLIYEKFDENFNIINNTFEFYYKDGNTYKPTGVFFYYKEKKNKNEKYSYLILLYLIIIFYYGLIFINKI